VQGQCLPECDPPYTRCGVACFDLQNDPQHCGSCPNACPSGICLEGVCAGPTAGHLILMGHDLTNLTPSVRRLFGNALSLASGDPVRVLAFDQKTSAAAKAGFAKAVELTAAATGRNYEVTVASSLAVTFLLGAADVFVIESQVDAKDSALIKSGESWSRALLQFIARGGVIVLLETKSSRNAGTFQILRAAGIFDAQERVSVGSTKLSMWAPGDAVSTGVPSVYKSGSETVGFAVHEPTVVVADPNTNVPVVVHIAR
jgi:hypothetical protein